MSRAVRLSIQVIEALRDRLHANLAYTQAVVAHSRFIVRDTRRSHQELDEVRAQLRVRPISPTDYLPRRRS
jgi:hypothetical protein